MNKCVYCGNVDRINHKDLCVDCGKKQPESKLEGVKVDIIEFDEFKDSYTLIYVTVDDNGKKFQCHLENMTQEDCEIIYGNIVDRILVWSMILQGGVIE